MNKKIIISGIFVFGAIIACSPKGHVGTVEAASETGGTGATTTADDSLTTHDVPTTFATLPPEASSTSSTSSTSSSSPSSDLGSSSCEESDEVEPPPCETWNDTCPECQKCRPYIGENGAPIYDEMGCFPESGRPKMLGEDCAFVESNANVPLEDCGKGLFCVEGKCSAFCQGGDWLCAEGLVCISYNDAYAVCHRRCDPLASDCEVGFRCTQYGSADFFVCSPLVESGKLFEACGDSSACVEGLGCFESSAADECEGFGYCCVQYCRTDSPECIGAGQKCEPLFAESSYPEYENTGYCTL